jgi:flagellar biosynthesis GTPase FlhF
MPRIFPTIGRRIETVVFNRHQPNNVAPQAPTPIVDNRKEQQAADERVEAARLEAIRLAAVEAARVAAETQAREQKAAAERAEAARVAAIRLAAAEAARVAAETQAREQKAAAERAEAARVAAIRLAAAEAARVAAETQAREQKATAERAEAARAAAEQLSAANADLSAAQKRIARIDRIADLFSAGKDIGTAAIARYLEQGNYPAALKLVLSEMPEGEIRVDFASLDQEEGEAVIKGVLKRIDKTIDALEDKTDVEPGAIEDLRRCLNVCKKNKGQLALNLAAAGTLNFQNLQIEDKVSSENAQVLINEQYPIPVAGVAVPHPGLIFSSMIKPAVPYLPQSIAAVELEQTDTEEDTQEHTQEGIQAVKIKVA